MALKTGICPLGDHPFEYDDARPGVNPTYCTPQHAWKASAQRQKDLKAQMDRRVCAKCREEKPSADFGSPTAPYCRPCHTGYERERRQTRGKQDPAYTRMLNLRRYGLTPETFAAMLADQGGRCAICGTDSPDGPGWHVDHDHSCCSTRKRSCGECTRGILCSRCNIALGNFRDDPLIIRSALRYVLAHLDRDPGEAGGMAFFGFPDNRGERSATAKLTEQIVGECRRRYLAGETQDVLAAEFGVTSGGMCSAIRGKTWAGLQDGVPPVPRELKPSQNTSEFREKMGAAGRAGAAVRWHPGSPGGAGAEPAPSVPGQLRPR